MGMDEVETAAADTTSEHSSSPRPRYHAHAYQPDHMTTPNYPSKMTGTPLPLSSDHHHTHHHHHHHSQQPTWEAGSAQLARGRDLDDPFGEFEGEAPPFKKQRIESIGDQSSQMSPETSVHVRRHHGDRPVGIAQPMQLRDAQQADPSLSSAAKEPSLSFTGKEDTELQKQKVPSHSTPTQQQQHSSSSSANPFHSSAQVVSEQPTAVAAKESARQSQSSGTFGDNDSTGSGAQVDLLITPHDGRNPLNYLDEVYDSDQSQESSQRFDKFINESSKSGGSSSRRSSAERLTLSDKQFESFPQESTTSSSSETSSESTAQFIATYVTPNLKYLDSDACIESSSDVKSLDSPSHPYDPPPPSSPPPPHSDTPPGMRASKEPFDARVPPMHGGGLDEEEAPYHLSTYDVTEKDYGGRSRQRSSSHLPSARPIASELGGGDVHVHVHVRIIYIK